MVYTKHDLLTNPILVNLIHKKLITLIPLSIAIIAVGSKNNCVAKELRDEYLSLGGRK